MSTKLTIKEEMRAIDEKDRQWYESLTEEEKSKLSIWLLMRYTSNANDRAFAEHFLEWTNEVVNVHFNKLRKHPQLQFQLLQVVGLGRATFHPWIAPGKAAKKNKIALWVAEHYPQFNDDEIDIFLSQHTTESLTELMEEYGLDKKSIKEILK